LLPGNDGGDDPGDASSVRAFELAWPGLPVARRLGDLG
jgi:hypothetical protein